MTDYGKIKFDASLVGILLDTEENASPKHVPSRQGNAIGSEPQALDAVANGGQFILFGNGHGNRDDQQKFISLIPTLARAHVKVIAVEMPVGLREFYSSLQTELRKGLKAKRPQQVLARYATDAIGKMMQDIGLEFTAGSELGAESMAALCIDATRHNIDVVPVDTRSQNSDWLSKRREIDSRIQTAFNGNDNKTLLREAMNSYHHSIALDAEAAANIHATLKGKPPGSRVAILYGEDHISQLPSPPPGSQGVLSDSLKRFGTVTTITPGRDEQFTSTRNYYIKPDFDFDVMARALRDHKPPPFQIRAPSSPSASQ